MTIEELASQVAPEWREGFRRFVETGEADEAFLAFLDEDATCQEAVEAAFSIQAQAFEKFAGTLEEAPGEPAEERAKDLSERMVRTLRATVALPIVERRRVTQSASEALKGVTAEQRKAIKDVVEELEAAV